MPGGKPILTTIQRQVLTRYRAHRHRPFTALGLLLPLWPIVALAAALIVLSAYIFGRQPTLFVAGVLVGAILRNVATQLHALRVVPAILQVIDWERVDRLLAESPGDG